MVVRTNRAISENHKEKIHVIILLAEVHNHQWCLSAHISDSFPDHLNFVLPTFGHI